MMSKSKDCFSKDAEITKAALKKDLKAIGVGYGDHLCLGISFKHIGFVERGPDGFIDALIETIGPHGTIMMNTHSKFFNMTEVRLGWVDYVFNYKLTSAITGIVPERLRHYKDTIRSKHPTCSVAAIGKFAEYLTGGHDENAEAYLPFSKLSNINGKYLAIGIGDRLVGLRHQAQAAAGLLNIIPWKRAVKYISKDGGIQTFIFKDQGGCVKRLPELVSNLREKGFVTDGVIGQAKAVLVPVREALEVMTNLLRENPAINLCDDVLCFWCRELERRMSLYKNIENPRYFQKYVVAIYLIALMNWLRERDNRVVARTKKLIERYIKK